MRRCFAFVLLLVFLSQPSDVAVASSPGLGSTFSAILPRLAPPDVSMPLDHHPIALAVDVHGA